MRHLIISSLFLTFLVVATLAVAAPKSSDIDAKKALILKLYEVQPPRKLIDSSIEAVANQRFRADDPDREEFISKMQLAIDYDQMEKKSIEFMVEIYTLPELQTMVDYYTSDIGQSIQSKTEDYRKKMAPELTKMLDAALLDTITSPSPAEAAENHN